MPTINEKPWALVTGASSGLGVDFARELAEADHNLVLVARQAEPMHLLASELEKSFEIQTKVISLDLAKLGVGLELKKIMDAENIAIEVLINNAGRGLYGPFIEQPLETTLGMLELNILGVTEITHAFAKDMVERGHGKILLIASIAAYQATPTYAAYSASKSFVLLFGEALHEELKPKGVTVTVLSPGITATNFLAVAGQKATFYQRLVMMQSPQVVRVGLAALQRGRASIVPGFVNKLTSWINRLSPRFIQRKIAYLLMKNK